MWHIDNRFSKLYGELMSSLLPSSHITVNMCSTLNRKEENEDLDRYSSFLAADLQSLYKRELLSTIFAFVPLKK